MMIKKNVVLLAFALLVPAASRAQNVVVDFESSGVGFWNQIGTYAGFNFSNILLLPSTYGANTSGQNAVYTHCCATGFVEIQRATPFTFVGANFRELYANSSQRIVGYLGGSEVFNQSINQVDTGSIFNDFSSFGSVDRLVFTDANGGTSDIGNTFFDDFTYSNAVAVVPTPEPSTTVLLASGLFGLAGAVRLRRKNQS